MFTGFHCGTVGGRFHAIVSVVRRSDGPGGKMYVPRDRYSFTMSFWVVAGRACGVGALLPAPTVDVQREAATWPWR